MSRERRPRLLHGSLPRLVLLLGLAATAAAALGALRLLDPVSGGLARPAGARSFRVAVPYSPIHAAKPARPAPDTAGRRAPATPSSDESGRGGSDALARADRAAVAFVRAWARPDLPQAAWLDGLEPLVTEGLADRLATDEPWAVPAHRVTANPRGHLRAGGAVVVVPTDAGPLAVTVVRRDNALLVNKIEAGV